MDGYINHTLWQVLCSGVVNKHKLDSTVLLFCYFFLRERTNTKLGKQGGWRDSEELEEGKEYAQVILYEILKKEKILF